MEIRYINDKDDRIAISDIYEESWKHTYKGIIPQEYLENIPKGRWSNKIDTPGWNTMVLIEDGKYVGTSSFCKSRFDEYADEGEIISIYFLPEYTKRGFGKALINAVVAELKALGYREIFLWVLEENDNARKFYEHIGFEPTDEYLSDEISGKAVREIRYILRMVR